MRMESTIVKGERVDLSALVAKYPGAQLAPDSRGAVIIEWDDGTPAPEYPWEPVEQVQYGTLFALVETIRKYLHPDEQYREEAARVRRLPESIKAALRAVLDTDEGKAALAVVDGNMARRQAYLTAERKRHEAFGDALRDSDIVTGDPEDE